MLKSHICLDFIRADSTPKSKSENFQDMSQVKQSMKQETTPSTHSTKESNSKQYFIKATQSAGIQTRIVPCVLELEYAPLKSLSQDAVEKEYQVLGEQGNDIISQAMHFLNKESDSSNAMIIELLSQIYQKVAKIERIVMRESSQLIALDFRTSVAAFGHGVICCEEECFRVGEEYYARFVLPNVLQRIIAVYAHAITPQIIKITSAHSSDMRVLDNYIAAKEMEQLREQRTK